MGQSVFSGSIGSGSVTISSGNVTATIAGNLPKPAATQTIIHVKITSSGTGVQNVYTVPANKIFYLFGCSFYASINTSGQIFENDGSTGVCQIGLTNWGATINSAVPIAQYTAGQVVKGQIGQDAGGISIFGYLESV